MIAESSKTFFKNIAKELHYHEDYVKQIDNCTSEKECIQVLENARIYSIDQDLKALTRKRTSKKWVF